jgi:hypothetical protein
MRRGGASCALNQPAMEPRMELRIDRHGRVECVYGEAIDLSTLGPLTIRRASHVEPDEQGRWWADLAPVGGPRRGPFAHRSEALRAEQVWLAEHWLGRTGSEPARRT